MVELRQLQYFLAVAERLSITEAARDLQMAQPALSQAITKMERQLGAVLFDRSKRRLRLTAAGATLVPEARQLVGRARVLESTLGRAGGERAHLRIGCIASAVSGLLPGVLPRFRAAHPHVVPVVQEMGQRAQLAALRDGAIDVGICRMLTGDDGVELTRLADEPLHCLLPAGHALAADEAVRLADLADEDVACFPRELAPVAHDTIVSACVRAGFSPRITQEAVNDQALLGIVACGLAVALVPRSTTLLRVDGVVSRPLTDPEAVTPLSVVVSATAPSPVGAAFRDAIVAAEA
ncbi:MAG TPA: LysR family transcriptional regulator [Pseudonocardia sp.]|jgi:DNA-binding transcriptional LysR family regulator|uniref:LysR family transcriptional regulator n=1 Tax=Pseudonocardia sp. TaxID=60912 RepID=UPI002B4B94F1|nr:LysR family transcriptional regulator [Pseudonocardia sp.]HLU56734.1 LysR family transcriptional regulator [Pseudonocardia sp.]